MIARNEHILALMLLTISTLIKILSVAILYTIYAHADEVPHDMEYKANIKQVKINTHQPLN